jgi:hypothetical protein
VLEPLTQYFKQGAQGQHLAFVQHSEQAHAPAQTDIFFVASFNCYASDVRAPLMAD